MTVRISDVIRERLGWGAASRDLKRRNVGRGLPLPSAGFVDGGDPQPGSNFAARSRFDDWFTGIAIVILFATLGFGGFFWWPFFVGAVLVAGLAIWYHNHVRVVR